MSDLHVAIFYAADLVFCGSRGLEIGRRLHPIPVLLIMVLLPVVMVHLSRGAGGDHWRGLVCLWIKRAGIGVPDPDSGFLARIGHQRRGQGGAVGDKVCVASILSASRCKRTVVSGDLGEGLEKERGDV